MDWAGGLVSEMVKPGLLSSGPAPTGSAREDAWLRVASMNAELPFPLYDPSYASDAFAHAFHCEEVVRLGANGTSPGPGLSVPHHVEHCVRLLNVTEAAKAAVGAVPLPVCDALFPAPARGVPPAEAPIALGMYAQLEEQSPWGFGPMLRDGRNLLFGSAKSAEEEEEEAKARVLSADEFEALKSSNFYLLLAKEEAGTASAEEQAYLDSWYGKDVAARYALAVTCKHTERGIALGNSWGLRPSE